MLIYSVNQNTFSEEVLEASQPVLVYFWAPWCGLCHLVQPFLIKIQSQWPEQIKLVSINADENLKLASTYNLKSLPTLILFDQGDMLQRLEDFPGREAFYKAVENMFLNLFPQ